MDGWPEKKGELHSTVYSPWDHSTCFKTLHSLADMFNTPHHVDLCGNQSAMLQLIHDSCLYLPL